MSGPQGMFVSLLLVLAGAQSPAGPTIQARAEKLASNLLIIDTHIDYPDLSKPSDNLAKWTYGQFDFPRAKQGGLKAAFMAIYVSAEDDAKGIAQQTADARIQLVEAMAVRWPEWCALARTPEEIRKNTAAGKLSLPMGMENGAPLAGDLGNVARYFDRGIRYLTLCHMKNNQLCDSSTAEAPKWHGLSPFGRQVVAEMNRVGMMIDVSHVSDETFEQVLALSKVPVIASHSSCRVFTRPGSFGYKRDLSDAMIKALAQKGGLIQITFGSEFLMPRDGRKSLADVKIVAAHIHHAVQMAGIDHVGIGSDYDGIGDSVATGLEDVSTYPNLIQELLRLNYSHKQIEKIMGGNLLRVWSEVERAAQP